MRLTPAAVGVWLLLAPSAALGALPQAPGGGAPSPRPVIVPAGGTLGASDPACAHPALLAAAARLGCKDSGSPLSPFPASNFGLDVHIDTGLTDPGNDAASIFQHFLGWIFGLFAQLLSAVFLALSVAFGFDLFSSDTGHIPRALAQAETFFTLPWIPFAFALGAIWGLARWFGARNEGRAVSHWVLMTVMMVLGLVIVQDPLGTLGGADRLANGAAQTSLAVFANGSPSSSGSYASAQPGLWRQMVEEPWCAVEFGSVDWCMAPVDPAMAAARVSVLAHLDQAAGDAAPPELAKAAEPLERARLAAARTNGEVFLSFPPGWDARNGKNDSWTLYHALLADRPDLAAIRGSGGVGDRFGDLALAGLGIVFFVLLLVYVGLNLLVAAIFFVVLLLFAPLMVLAPAFGDAGRATFWRWLGWLLGALAAKLIYAVYLGVLILASGVVEQVAASVGGWLVRWILFCAIWGLGWVYRRKFLGLFTGGGRMAHHHEGRDVAVGAAAGWVVGHRPHVRVRRGPPSSMPAPAPAPRPGP